MHRLTLAVLLVGLALVAFGLWGLFIPAGRSAYPAAAATTPFYALVAGLACVAVAGTARGLRRYRGRGTRAT